MPEPELVAFTWDVEVGPLAGDRIELAFKAPPDFNLSAPGGLLVRPHLLPINRPAASTPTAASTLPAAAVSRMPAGSTEVVRIPTGPPPIAPSAR